MEFLFFLFRYFSCHHEYIIDKAFNVWERRQVDKNSLSPKKKEKINSNWCVMLSAIYGFISVDGDIEISYDM